MSGITLRPAREEDRDLIRALHLATHAEHRAREKGYDEPPFDADILARLREGPAGGCLVAERGGAFAGYLAWSRHAKGRRSVIVVNDISVRPEHRRCGVGRALLGGVQAAAERWQAPAIVAPIWPGNAASQASFTAAGYRLDRPGADPRLVDAVRFTGISLPTPRWAIALAITIAIALALAAGLALGHAATRLIF